jgi:hypothetical protein
MDRAALRRPARVPSPRLQSRFYSHHFDLRALFSVEILGHSLLSKDFQDTVRSPRIVPRMAPPFISFLPQASPIEVLP